MIQSATFRKVCGHRYGGMYCFRRAEHHGECSGAERLVYHCTKCNAVSHLYDLGGSSKHHCGGFFQAPKDSGRATTS